MLQGMTTTLGSFLSLLLLLAPTAKASVVINEVAWMGTAYSPNDEWIELFNPGALARDLDGWTLRWNGHVVALEGNIPARGYYVLERTDDSSVSGVKADVIYTGSLRNAGEALELFDAHGVLVDSANGDGGPWPAGDNASKHAMARLDPGAPDHDDNWGDATGETHAARDAGGGWIVGTPGALNVARAHVAAPSPNGAPKQRAILTKPWVWLALAGVVTLWWLTRP